MMGRVLKNTHWQLIQKLNSGNKNMLAMIDYDIMARHKTYDMNRQIFLI